MKRSGLLIVLISFILLSCSKKDNVINPEKPEMTISGFSPATASTGEEVTITGANFESSTTITVKFGNGGAALAKVRTTTQISVSVPFDAQSGQISLSDGNITVKSTASLTVKEKGTVIPPSYSGIAPTSANIGQEVTITGANFGTDVNRVTIRFSNEMSIAPKSVTPTQIIFVVPEKAASGVVTISFAGLTHLDSQPLTIIAPTVPDVPPPVIGYTIKQIGISFIDVGVNQHDQITTAQLYGGGNRIVLKKGSGYTMSANMVYENYPLNGLFLNYNAPIDNGIPFPADIASKATIIKLKGFDRAKTGYDELHLVMQKYTNVVLKYQNGYRRNHGFTETNSLNYGLPIEYMNQIFSGDIDIALLNIAKPRAEKPYITEDYLICHMEAYYDFTNNKVTDVDFQSVFWRCYFDINKGSLGYMPANKIKIEWVNADKGTVKKASSRIYQIEFDNIIRGRRDQVVMPADSVDKVYLRITGFDREQFGVDQLRLFLYEDPHDGLSVNGYLSETGVVPTFSMIKSWYNVEGMYCHSFGAKYEN